MFCFVLANHPNRSCKCSACKHTFLKHFFCSQGGKIRKCCPCFLVWRARPLASNLLTLRRLITTTTTTDYMLVFVLQKILSQLGLLGQNIMLHFHLFVVRFLLLLSVCIQCASFMRMLHLFFSVFGEFQVQPIGLEYELKHVES